MDLGKVGKFIAELRKEKKLTQAQLGEKVGVTDKTVSKWEQGICAPNISILNELSKILGITTTELLNGKRFENISKKELADTTTKGMKYYINLSKKKLIKKMFIAILVTIILAISIIAFLFFKNNYDNCYVYELSSVDPNYAIEGVLIESPEKEIFIINLVKNLSDVEFSNKKIYSYEYSFLLNGRELYSKGNVELYHYNKKDRTIFVNEALEKVNIYNVEDDKQNYKELSRQESVPNITLQIKILNSQLEIEIITININLEKIYVNDKIQMDYS